MAFVSLITPTQPSREKSIFLLKDMILEQTYVHKIKEWVISSKYDLPFLETLQSELAAGWQKLISQDKLSPPVIKFVKCEEDSKIGRLRNKANNAATQDILICLDDDDYYPPERVEHAYEELIKSDKLIAGCSPTYIYDFVFEHQYQFISLGQNHTINCATAFKKEYLVNNSHDETCPNAEEFSFTKLWTQDMIQLDPLKTLNVSSHMGNTYNKRQLEIAFHHGKFPQFQNIPTCLIPKKYYDRMKEVFLGKPDQIMTNAEGTVSIPIYNSPYDIVYFCGNGIPWSPEDESLGGSEQAVKYLAIEWAKKGKKVAVYANIDTKENLPEAVFSKLRNLMPYKGVDFINWVNFPYHQTFNNLIIWRAAGIAFSFFVRIKAKKLFLDLHDNGIVVPIVDSYKMFLQNNRPFDRIMFKSNYHRKEFERLCSEAKTIMPANEIIPNGLRIKEFQLHDNQRREEFRFCYASCYTRGLEQILRFVWPEIIKVEPRAELHVYYGMDYVQDANYKKGMHELIGASIGVCNHGRKPLDIIAAEKYKSSYQLYMTESPAEIDCISIREAVLAGCIPIVSNKGVFIERDGIHLGPKDGEPAISPADYVAAGKAIAGLLRNHETIYKIRQQLKSSIMLIDWEEVAARWMTLLN